VRAGHGKRSGAVLVVFLLALLSVTSWPVTASLAATGGCGADMGTRQVVVLVHGFNSDMTTWTKAKPAMLAAVHDADPANVYVRLFDYGAKSTQWVTDPAIGPALASFVRCLAQASTTAGGPGKVILVGHSMGGLAIRCAMDPGCSPNPVGKDQVGLVVTIGTPNAGSQLRPSPAADATDRTAGEAVLALCDIAQIIDKHGSLTAPCKYARALSVSPAGQAFTIGSREIDELAPYPLHIPVRAIAGAMTLQADIGFWKYPVPMGDIIVGVDSQLLLHTDDRLGGTRTVDCGAVNMLGGAVDILVGLRCWHITETAYAPIQNEVRQAVKDYLSANPATERVPAPVTASTVLTLPATSSKYATGLTLYTGQSVKMAASGITQYGADNSVGCVGTADVDSNGKRTLNSQVCVPKYDAAAELPAAPIGALLYSPDAGNHWVRCGTSCNFTAMSHGPLWIGYNDSEYGNNTGSYQVTTFISSK
jgi:pimeloyl-ACP methyl ester carboxylesterase